MATTKNKPTMPVRHASNIAYWCFECGHAEPCEIRQSPNTIRSFSVDGGDLGRGMGSVYMVGPVDWRVWPTMRCGCRVAAEKQWELERLALECLAWEACGGRATKSRHRYREPEFSYDSDEDNDFNEWDDDY